jgi:outer membrane protein
MRFLCTVVLCLLAIPASAQKKTLTLEEAKQIALERNLSVVQAQNNLEAAQSQVLAARGLYLPTVTASSGWNRSQQEFKTSGTQYTTVNGILIPIAAGEQNQITLSNSFSGGVRASLNVFDGFARQSSNASATSQAIASEYSAGRTRQSVVFQVVSDYLNVFRTQQLVGVAEENLKRDQRQLERIVESNRVGALSLADVYRQQSQVASDELLLITAQNNYDKAKADLLAMVGLNVGEEYEIADATIPSTIDSLSLQQSRQMVDEFDSLSARAIRSRPDYQAAVQSLDAAEAGVTNARSNYFPSLGISAGYTRTGDDISNPFKNSSISWGANLSWTLFDGFRTNQAIQLAAASKRNAQIQLAQTEITVDVDVKKALLDLDASRKSYEASQKGLVSATEDRKIAEERYNLGAGTLLDLLTANANLVSAQANKVNAVYSFLTSKYNVEFAVGEQNY